MTEVLKRSFRLILIVLNIVLSASVHSLFMFLLKHILKKRPNLFNRIERIFFLYIQVPVATWVFSGGYEIYDNGEDISRCINEESLVIVNHQTTADVPCLIANFQEKDDVLCDVMWVLDIMFKWSPFGWACRLHNDFFIQQGRSTRNRQLELFSQHLQTYFNKLNRKWLIVFPEGGFLYKRRESSQNYARQHGYPHVEHVTLPRAGACLVAFKTLSEQMYDESDLSNKQTETQYTMDVGGEEAVKNDSGSQQNQYILDAGGEEVKKDSVLNQSLYTSDAALPEQVKNESGSHQNSSLNSLKSKATDQNYVTCNSNNQDVRGDSVVRNRHDKGQADFATEVANFEYEPASSEHSLKWVIDVTIGYRDKNRPLDLLSVALGKNKRSAVDFFYRVYPASSVPHDSEHELLKWMYDRWVEKNERLSHYYETGEMAWLDDVEYESVPEEYRMIDARLITFSRERVALAYLIHVILIYIFYWKLPWYLYSLF